jgi:hypothetical protein
MDIGCPTWLSSIYTNPNDIYGKDYLLINKTNKFIRFKAYIMPKYVGGPGNEMAGKCIEQMFKVPPGYCKLSQLTLGTVIFPEGPYEMWDHFFAPPVLDDAPYWTKYLSSPSNYVMHSRINKVAFIEFWVDEPGAQKHLLGLSLSSGIINNATPGRVDYFSPCLNKKVDYVMLGNNYDPNFNTANPLALTTSFFEAYYYIPGVGTTVTDSVYGIKGYFDYMSNVISYTHNYDKNPSANPGYIITFE